MNPTWADGGLYYPRNDTVEDRGGNRTMIEPMSGNALLGYARLNIPDGLWHFYNDPWEASHFEEPAVSRVGDDVDISLALFDKSANRLKLAWRGAQTWQEMASCISQTPFRGDLGNSSATGERFVMARKTRFGWWGRSERT